MHPTRREKTPLHRVVEVRQHLSAAGEFGEALVGAHVVDVIGAELGRVQPIEERRLMQPDVRVSVIPMAPWLVATLHERHRGIAVAEDLVDERHTHGTSTNDHIVGNEATASFTGGHHHDSTFDRLGPSRLVSNSSYVATTASTPDA